MWPQEPDDRPGGMTVANPTVADVAARMYRNGWMRGTSGNISRRRQVDPLILEVSASGVPKDRLGPDDAIAIDQLGRPLPGQAGAPSAEALVHSVISQKADAGGVVHVHLHSSVLAAALDPGGVPLAGIEQLKGLGLPADERVVIPVVPNSQDMTELSGRIRDVMEPRIPVVIVAGHGVYVWGRDLEEAAQRTESVDWLLSLSVECHRLGISTFA